MKRITNRICFPMLLSLAVIVLSLFTSCSSNDDEPTDTRATETIIMFFPYSEGLNSIFNRNIRDMESAIAENKGMGNTRIVILKTSDSDARIAEIVYNNGVCEEKVIESNAQATFDSYNQPRVTASLQNFFRKIKEAAPAKSYSMIIGAHGKGWLPAGNFALEDLYDAGRKKALGSAAKTSQIENTSIVTALQNEDMHLNFLLLDACYMGNIETAYDFHNICDYFISSPTEVMDLGIPYQTAGAAIIKHDYQAVVNEFHKFYSSYRSPYGTLSVVDCNVMDEMTEVMGQINRTGLRDASETPGIQAMDAIDPTVFFDMADYVTKCCTDEALKARYISVMQRLVPYKSHTERFYSATPRGAVTTPIETYCGLTISQPTENKTAAQHITQSAWWIATH